MVCLEESGPHYQFHCRSCKLIWMVSKDKTKMQAREANRIKKLEELSAAERGQVAKFFAPKGGWTA